jgi:hypothetical protein
MKLKSVTILVASLFPTVAYVVTQARRSIRSPPTKLQVAARNLTEVSPHPKPRDIIAFLSNRYGEGDWTKTRNYVYHTKDKLSLHQVEGVLDFLDINFDNTQIRSILQSSPRILRKNPFSKLKPTAKFLKQLYGKDMFHEAVSRNPDLLLISGLGYDTSIDNPIEPFLQRELKLSKSDVQKLQQTSPFFFQIPLAKIKLVTTYLMDLLQDGDYSHEDAVKVIAKVVLAHPHLFHLSVDANLQPRIDFLVKTCNLSSKNVASLIKSSSGILGLSVEDNFKPTLYYLLQVLDPDSDAGRHALNKCVLSHPPILALSQRNMEQKVMYFDAIDPGGDGGSLAARIAMRSPVVYSLSLKDNILPTVEFLAKVWGARVPRVSWRKQDLAVVEPDPHGCRDATLGTLLREYPGILTLSLEGNLQPTFNFYNKTGYTVLDDDWTLVKGKLKVRGRYIAASLFHRLLPRWHYWMDQNTADKPPLHIIAGSTDANLCKLLGYDLETYQEFKEKSAPRLKFSSQFDTWLKTGRAIDV